MVNAVEHPWAQVIALPDQTCSTLPPDTNIQDVFRQRGKLLLILGGPGSGKTTTLLDLTRSLIIEAEADSERLYLWCSTSLLGRPSGHQFLFGWLKS